MKKEVDIKPTNEKMDRITMPSGHTVVCSRRVYYILLSVKQSHQRGLLPTPIRKFKH